MMTSRFQLRGFIHDKILVGNEAHLFVETRLPVIETIIACASGHERVLFRAVLSVRPHTPNQKRDKACLGGSEMIVALCQK